jgi:hypothetical protein
MGINFPNAPIVNQLWPQPPVAGVPVYVWDGQKWTTQGTPATRTPVYTDGSTPMAAQLKLFGSPPVATNDAVPKSYADALPAVHYDAAQALTDAQRSQARANIGVLKKNYIINGAMVISQEWGTTVLNVSGNYPVDQFAFFYSIAGATSGNYNYAQVASPTPGGSSTRLRVTVMSGPGTVAAGDYAALAQNIEGIRVADLRSGTPAAKTVTLQFGWKSPAGTYSVALRNGAYTRSYTTFFTIAAGEANTDVVRSVTIALDQAGAWVTDNTQSFVVNWAIIAGTTSQGAPNVWTAGSFFCPTGGTTNAPNGSVFELFDVSLTVGTVAPPFVMPDTASELLVCQRYFESGVQPYKYISGLTGVTSAYDTIPFIAQKRTNGTVIFANWLYFNSGGSSVAFTPVLSTVFVNQFFFTSSGLVNWCGWSGNGTWIASARM